MVFNQRKYLNLLKITVSTLNVSHHLLNKKYRVPLNWPAVPQCISSIKSKMDMWSVVPSSLTLWCFCNVTDSSVVIITDMRLFSILFLRTTCYGASDGLLILGGVLWIQSGVKSRFRLRPMSVSSWWLKVISALQKDTILKSYSLLEALNYFGQKHMDGLLSPMCWCLVVSVDRLCWLLQGLDKHTNMIGLLPSELSDLSLPGRRSHLILALCSRVSLTVPFTTLVVFLWTLSM